MKNFIEKINDGFLNNSVFILKSIFNQYNNNDIDCKCNKCIEFLNYVSELNKKRELHSYEKESNLFRKDFMYLNHKVINLDNLYNNDSVFSFNLKRFFNLGSHSDWNCFGNYYYCSDCFSFYDISNFYLDSDCDDNESYAPFLSDISIECIDNPNEIISLLPYLFVYLNLIEFENIYTNLDFNSNCYVYSRLEYDLNINPLFSFSSDVSRVDFIEKDLFYKNLYSDFESSKRLIVSNSIYSGSSGFCRLLIDEKDLVFDITTPDSGLSGFLSGFSLNILKSKVKNIEFYDIVNDCWVSYSSDNLQDVIKSNNVYLSNRENLDIFYSIQLEKNPIVFLLDYFETEFPLLEDSFL